MMNERSFDTDLLKAAIRQDRNGEALRILGNSQGVAEAIFRLAAQTGAGRLEEARKTAQFLDETFSSGKFPEARDLGEVMIGNLFLTEGRVAEAFDRYETGIHPGEADFLPHVRLFGSIWRELGLAHFGDLGSVQRLEDLGKKAEETGEAHLSRLARSFCLVAGALTHQTLETKRMQKILGAFDEQSAPGLFAQALAAADLSETESGMEPHNGEKVLRLCLSCEGLKGEPLLMLDWEKRFSAWIDSQKNGSDFRNWLAKYIHPILSVQEQNLKGLFPHLPERPFLKPVNCARCDGRCCYDGVYITAEEEIRIRDFMNRYPAYFGHVPKDFTEEGEWGFLFHGKRTLRVPHAFDRLDFPAHFQKTKCVFAYPNGECSLQKAATENGYHPWRFKPTSCWEFPLIGLFNDDAWEHPHYFGVPDPGYCDEKNPGYVSFMPCARVREDGVSWKRLFKNELQYFLYQKKKNQ